MGHETDITLADLAADVRAPTPTAAAELAAPTRSASLELLRAFADAMGRRVHQALDAQGQRLDRATVRLMRPADGVRRHAQRLSLLAHRLAGSTREQARRQLQRNEALANRLQRARQVALNHQQARLQSLAARLDGLDPARVLSRGYAWLEAADGQAVTSAASLSAGQQVRAVLADGVATAEVTGVNLEPPRPR